MHVALCYSLVLLVPLAPERTSRPHGKQNKQGGETQLAASARTACIDFERDSFKTGHIKPQGPHSVS